jgi:hypothetical protein
MGLSAEPLELGVPDGGADGVHVGVAVSDDEGLHGGGMLSEFLRTRQAKPR